MLMALMVLVVAMYHWPGLTGTLVVLWCILALHNQAHNPSTVYAVHILFLVTYRKGVFLFV